MNKLLILIIVALLFNGISCSKPKEIIPKLKGELIYYASGNVMSYHEYNNKNEKSGWSIKKQDMLRPSIIAVGPYQNDQPWDGYFLLGDNDSALTDVRVIDTNYAEFIIKYSNGVRDGKPFKGTILLENYINSQPELKKLVDVINMSNK